MAVTNPEDRLDKLFRWVSGPTGADSSDMVVVASSGSPSVFEIGPPSGEDWNVMRVNFKIYDPMSDPTKFGALSALTNGCKIEILDASDVVVHDYMDGLTVKTSGDFGLLAGPDVAGIETSKTVDVQIIRWTLAKGTNDPNRLPEGARIRITIQDDLTGINEFRAMLQAKKC